MQHVWVGCIVYVCNAGATQVNQRPVLRSWINIPGISLRYLGYPDIRYLGYPDIHSHDQWYYEAGYQLGKSTQGFLIWITAHIKGRCLQCLTNHKHGETLQSYFTIEE